MRAASDDNRLDQAHREDGDASAFHSVGRLQEPVRVLFVEDSEDDIEILVWRLKKGGIPAQARRVDTEADFREALEEFRPEIVLCDNALPNFSGAAALRQLRNMRPDIPCIFVSGAIGEEAAVEVLKAGASDVVLKNNLTRLAPAVRRALEDAASRREVARLQRELSDSEAKFRSLTELSSDWYWEQDSEFRFTGVAGSYGAKSGLAESNNIGKRRWEISAYEVTPEQWAQHRALLDAHKPFRDFELKRTVNDEVRYHSISGEPFFGANGEFKGYRGLGRDITQRKLAEDSLLRFRAAMDAALDAIYIADANTLQIIDVNVTACVASGYSRDELLTMTIDGILSSISRDEIQAAYQKAIMMAPAAVTFEAFNRRKDGTEYPVEVRRHAIRSNDRYLMVGIARDISDRKRAEESLRRFRAAMDVSVDAIYISDVQTLRILDVNTTACKVTGYSREELLQTTIDAILPRFTAEEVQAAYADTIEPSPRAVTLETIKRRKDGSEYPVEVHRRVIRSADRYVMVGIARDIRQRQRAFDEVKLRTEQQSTVASLGAYALASRNLDEVLGRAVRDIARLLGVEYARVMEYLPSGEKMTVRAAFGWPDQSVGHAPIDADARARRTSDSNEPVFLFDMHSETRADTVALREFGIRSGLSVTIPGPVGAFGVLDVHSSSRRRFTKEDGNFLSAVANVMAAAVQRRRSEDVLRLRDRAIEASVNSIVIANALLPDLPIEYVNPAFERITGYSAAEAVGQNCRFLQRDDHDQPGLENIRSAVRTKTDGRAVIRNYRKDGRLFWNELHIAPVRDDAGKVTHYIGVQNDVTETRNYQEQLEHQANHDELTGLPNRNLLRDRISQAIFFAHRQQQFIAFAFLDLDHFKYINDSLGHSAGDEVLKTIGKRLSTSLREGDTVARVGGDEFALVLLGQANRDSVPDVIRRIVRRISEPVTVEGRDFEVSCSLGVSIYPDDGTDTDTLLRNADVAMYRAKERGRNMFMFYSQEMNEQITERMTLEANLRRALGRNEFQLHYQPRVNLSNGRITGVEALIRWHHPELGMVPPGRFIALAEELGLIDVIGDWVLKTACKQAREWVDAGLPPIVVAVNLSARQLMQPSSVRSIELVLRESGMDLHQIELEITEGTMMTDPVRTGRTLADLKSLGVSIAIDDFGTGYSSLNYLKHFRINCLKIDQSFVRGVPGVKDDVEITRAIVALGKSLGLKLIAEGIEHVEQLAFLKAIGCEEGQGFYFSRPVPPQHLLELLKLGFITPPDASQQSA